jgi:hypothetical protein
MGFVHARDAPKARRGLTEDTLDARTERSEGLAERWDWNQFQVLKTNNLTGFRFLTIRQNRWKAQVETRIEHANEPASGIQGRRKTIHGNIASAAATRTCGSSLHTLQDDEIGCRPCPDTPWNRGDCAPASSLP